MAKMPGWSGLWRRCQVGLVYGGDARLVWSVAGMPGCSGLWLRCQVGLVYGGDAKLVWSVAARPLVQALRYPAVSDLA